MRRLITILLSGTLLIGCKSSSKLSKLEPAPSWVTQRPAETEYYIGIGSARKNNSDYQQVAKQNALADLASDISIVISSTSVLNTHQKQQRFFEDFTSNIKTDTHKELEGYELVSTWEDQQNYWVYYRLSKEDYHKKREENKSIAAAKSLDFYEKALIAKQNSDEKTAIIMLVKALEPIKPFITEPIVVNYQNQDLYLYNEIIENLTNIFNSIIITGLPQLKAKMGEKLETQFFVQNTNATPLKSLPIKIVYTENPMISKYFTTDIEGKITFSIDRVKSLKLSEQLKVSLDIEKLIQEATSDFSIKKALLRMNIPSFETKVNIEKPIFFVSSEEINLDKTTNKSLLANGLKRKLTERGFPLTDDPSIADYKIFISSSTSPIGQSGQFVQVALTLQIVVNHISGKEVYRIINDKINGTHLNPSDAGEIAYKEALKRIDNTFAQEIIDNVVKGKRVY